MSDHFVLWPRNQVARAIAALAIHGGAMSADALASLVGGDVRSLKNRLAEDERVARTGPNLYGLVDWGVTEYTGIASSIAKAITASGGRALTVDIVTQVAGQYSVKESSVRVYCDAVMFVVEGEMIRLRSATEPYPLRTRIARVKGAFLRPDGSVVLHIPVDRELLRGSGRALSEDLSGYFGISPGGSLTFASSAGNVMITWPVTSFRGPSLGSLRGIAMSVGAAEGDLMRVIFSLHDAEVQGEKVAKWAMDDPTTEGALEELTGLTADGDWIGTLARAIDVSEGAVRRTLRDRRDTPIASALPVKQVEDDLSSIFDGIEERLAGD